MIKVNMLQLVEHNYIFLIKVTYDDIELMTHKSDSKTVQKTFLPV